MIQRIVESFSIPGSSALTTIVGAVSQATVGKKVILNLAYSYYKAIGKSSLTRRIIQFTPAGLSAILGGPVGILISPLVGLISNLIGDALLVLGHSVALLGNVPEDSKVSTANQAKDILGDLATATINSFSPFNIVSIVSIAKNGFEIYYGIKKLQELNTRADSIMRTYSKDNRNNSNEDGYDDITIDMGDVEVDEYDDPTIIDVTPGERRTEHLPGGTGSDRSLPYR